MIGDLELEAKSDNGIVSVLFDTVSSDKVLPTTTFFINMSPMAPTPLDTLKKGFN